MNYVIFRS